MTMRSKIIHLRSAEFFGGPERAILGQCRALNDFDFVCASFDRGPHPNRFLSEAQAAGLETAAIPDAFAGDFRVVGRLVRLIHRTRADILVGHDYKANFYGLLAARLTGVRQIAHFRGYTTEDRKVRLYNFLNAILLRRMSLVLAVSSQSAEFLVESGVAREKIRVVPNAIEKERLSPPDFKRDAPLDRPLKAICAGRLSREKGYDVLLEAVAQIRAEAPPFTIDIYGHGPEETALKSLAGRLGVDNIVFFGGFVADVVPLLREADLLLLPSRSEGMPNILLEAWGQKLAAVATAVGGVGEMISDGQSGYLAPPDNPRALGRCLLAALQNPEKLPLMGEYGYREVRGKYNYSRQAGLLREIYGRPEGN